MSISIRTYLAITASELAKAKPLPERIAWMACHFSPYGTGLSNLPHWLPEGSLVILSDRIPICKHDPAVITAQLLQLLDERKPEGFLLDLERGDSEDTARLAEILTGKLPCPVAVSGHYARDLDCPVFLPPPPLYEPLEAYLARWQGREIWLEIATDAQTLILTPKGCVAEHSALLDGENMPFQDENLFCRYRIELTENVARFTLLRDIRDLQALMEKAAGFGVTRGVGLYQQLGRSL